MKHSIVAFFLLVVLAITGAALAKDRKQLPPDEQNQYVVSAKAGLVNLVEGEATVQRHAPFALPQVLISGDELQPGDTVRTGPNTKSEILLNPGCYLRSGESCEFVFLFDGRSNHNRIKLLRGSVIIETAVSDEPILVTTPGGDVTIISRGVYRFNVGVDDTAEVRVSKGRALSGQNVIKEGKFATLNGADPLISSFNAKVGDELDDWSKQRAQTLTAANKQLSNRGMKRSIAMGSIRNSWIYDPFCRCYTFLPFTGGFSSPYGWGYSVCNPYWYRSPGRYNDGGWSGGGGYAGGQPGGGASSGGGGPSGGGFGGQPSPSIRSESPGMSAPSRGGPDAQPPTSSGGRRP